jgi:hypothetical protein
VENLVRIPAAPARFYANRLRSGCYEQDSAAGKACWLDLILIELTYDWALRIHRITRRHQPIITLALLHINAPPLDEMQLIPGHEHISPNKKRGASRRRVEEQRP